MTLPRRVKLKGAYTKAPMKGLPFNPRKKMFEILKKANHFAESSPLIDPVHDVDYMHKANAIYEMFDEVKDYMDSRGIQVSVVNHHTALRGSRFQYSIVLRDKEGNEICQ